MINRYFIMTVICLTAMMFSTTTAQAEPLTFSYQGVVDSSDGGGTDFSDLVGEMMTVTYTFESTTPDSAAMPPFPFPIPNQGTYPAITAIQVSVGSFTYMATAGTIGTRNDDPLVNFRDEYTVSASERDGLMGLGIGGIPVERFRLRLSDPDGTVFDSDALPATQPNPLDFGITSMGLSFSGRRCPTCGSEDAELSVSQVMIMPPAGLDHFLCYKAKSAKREPKFERLDVDLEDQFGLTVKTVKKPRFLCTPVAKDGEPVINPAGHLVCYEVKGHDEFEKRNVLVFNQFEDEVEGRILTIKKPKILCVPSTKKDLVVVGDDDD